MASLSGCEWRRQAAAAGSDCDCVCRPGEGVRYLVCLSRRCEDNVARWNPAELVMHVDTIAFILQANPSQLANKLYKLIQPVLACRQICGYVRLAQSVHIHSPWLVFD